MRVTQVPEVIAPPWCLYGAAYAQCFWSPSAAAKRHADPTVDPDAAAHGSGVLAFLRYEASNVGPYDELLWLSLKGANSAGHWQPSVEKIFVSTEASRVSGRANWGIPKELASFEVSRIAPRAEQVRVSVEGATIAALTVSTSRLSVPANLSLFPRPMRTILQRYEGSVYRFAPAARGRLHRARFSECYVDPQLFPNVAAGRRIGAFSVQELRLEFPRAVISGTL
jgi:hypothetical protein